MATPSKTYLAKIRRGVRVRSHAGLDAELTDIIEECRLDLIALGVHEDRANDETDALILGAIRSFARWKFGLGTDEGNRSDYMLQRDELRRRAYYQTGDPEEED